MQPQVQAATLTRDVLFDFTTLPPKERNKLLLSTIVPRPIAWIGSLDLEGRLNAAPFSFFNAFAVDPPVVGVGIGGNAAAAAYCWLSSVNGMRVDATRGARKRNRTCSWPGAGNAHP
jgi:hypothetical protein